MNKKYITDKQFVDDFVNFFPESSRESMSEYLVSYKFNIENSNFTLSTFNLETLVNSVFYKKEHFLDKLYFYFSGTNSNYSNKLAISKDENLSRRLIKYYYLDESIILYNMRKLYKNIDTNVIGSICLDRQCIRLVNLHIRK